MKSPLLAPRATVLLGKKCTEIDVFACMRPHDTVTPFEANSSMWRQCESMLAGGRTGQHAK